MTDHSVSVLVGMAHIERKMSDAGERSWIAEWGVWLGKGHKVYVSRNQSAKAFGDRGRSVGKVEVGVGSIFLPAPGLSSWLDRQQVESERGNGSWRRKRAWTSQLEKSCSQHQAST